MNYVIAGWLNVQGTTSSSHETLTNNAIFLLISFQSLKGGLQNAWKKSILDKGTETGQTCKIAPWTW